MDIESNFDFCWYSFMVQMISKKCIYDCCIWNILVIVKLCLNYNDLWYSPK